MPIIQIAINNTKAGKRRRLKIDKFKDLRNFTKHGILTKPKIDISTQLNSES